MNQRCLTTFVGVALLAAAASVAAQEAAIRENLRERLPNLPKIDEVTKTPLPGLWEVRLGSEGLYTDDTGQYLIQGELIDLRAKANLTQQRLDKLSAFDFSKLPLKDAIVIRQGKGTRKMALFVDGPQCGRRVSCWLAAGPREVVAPSTAAGCWRR
jgi:thiol:disulfide interchange protein DsbC